MMLETVSPVLLVCLAAETKTKDGTEKEVEQVTKQYKPGRNIGITAVYPF